MTQKTIKRTLLFAATMIVTLMMTGILAMADSNVKPNKITRLNYSSRTVTIGKEFTLKAYTSPKDCNENQLVWSIKNKSIVAFDETDHTDDDMDFIAKKAGTTTITCTIKGTSKKKTCKVTVKASTTKGRIVVDDTYMDIDLGEWDDIEARLVGGSYKSRALTYTVADSSIAKVSSGMVYGKKVGKTKITIKAKADSSIKKVIWVTVEYDYDD